MTLNCNDDSTAPRVINLVVSCTNRKKLAPSAGLSIHELRELDFGCRLKHWVANLQQIHAPELKAAEMYSGDHWSIARSIADGSFSGTLAVRLWICSAGYGLISPATQIKAYRATFSAGQDDYIGAGLKFEDKEEALRQWWNHVSASALRLPEGPRSLSELAEHFGRVPMLVVLSPDYLMAIQDDLRSVVSRPYFRRHLSIISSGTPSAHPLWKDHLLPSGADLAGTLGGTLTSLNIRVARWLLDNLNGSEPDVENLSRLCRSIERKPLDIPLRRNASDSEVIEFVKSWLQTHPGTSKTPLLAAFRQSGRACEQSRFGRIYASVTARPEARA